MGHWTIVWSDGPAADLSLVRQVAATDGAELREVARDAVVAAIAAAILRGGVVYLAVDARDASRALGAGADEVVRFGHLSRATLLRAMRRAHLRASARAARADHAARAPEDVGKVLSLLTAAVGHEMNTPLSVALLTCEALNEGLPHMLDVQERLMGWATLAAPQPELRNLVKCIARQPSPSEVRIMLSDLREGLGRAAKVAHLIRRLSSPPPASITSAADTIVDICELLRGALGEHTAVDVTGRCLVRVARPTLVLILAGLLAHAIEAVRHAPRRDASMRIQASEQDDAVLVEIAHDGRAIPADLRPGAFEPYFALGNGASAGDLTLGGLQRRARSLGGELLVLGEEDTTTLRLVLPALDAELEGDATHVEPIDRGKLRQTD